MTRSARAAAWAAAATAALALAGCGSASTSGTHPGTRPPVTGVPKSAGPSGGIPSGPVPAATTLIADMKGAVNSARSVHVNGQVTDHGKHVGLNVGIQRNGNLAGTITENGLPVNLIVVGGTAYVKATSAFIKQLNQPASVCALVCGKYVQLPASQASQLTKSLSLPNITKSLTGKTPKVISTTATTAGGQPAYELRAANGGKLDVAANGTHYPVVLTSAHGAGVVTFTQWNAVPAPVLPPKNQIVKI